MNFKYSIAKTENGMDVIAIERPSSPMVSFQIWVRAGSKYERPGITGISHMIEHMMFKGSRNYGPQEHAKRIQEMGGEFNAFTSHDKTVYYENISPIYLEEVVKMEADRFLYPLFDEGEFLRERDVVMEERLMRTDNSPQGKALEELFAISFVAHPYHWPVIGWKSDIASYSLDHMLNYFKERYSPENIFFVLSGQITMDKTLSLLNKYFGKWEKDPPEKLNITQEPQQKGNRWSEIIMEVEVPFVFMSFVLPGFTHKDFPLIPVLEKIITSGESSRLWKHLVHKLNIATSAGGGFYPLGDYSLFFLYSIAKTGVEPRILETEMVKALENPEISETEMMKARNQALAETLSSLEKSFHTGLMAGESYLNTGDPELFIKHLNILQRAKKEQIIELWETYLAEGKRNTVILRGDK